MYILNEKVKVVEVKQITPDMEIAVNKDVKHKFSERCDEDGFMTFIGIVDGKGVIQKNCSGDYIVKIEGGKTDYLYIPKTVFETLFENKE